MESNSSAKHRPHSPVSGHNETPNDLQQFQTLDSQAEPIKTLQVETEPNIL